jgi:hypothetical protein
MRTGLTWMICLIVLAGPTAQAAETGSVGRAVGQPFRDLSLIQDKAPEVLKRAAEGPYDLTRIADCPQLRQEIADLDAALGPDLDELGTSKGTTVDSLAADLIGGVVKLPFRGILRRVSGAQAREEAMRAAVLAGMVRRGFLKGRLSQLACQPD